ncbi:hypothetical protein DPMN_069296 [Dreissena polymorpha]|uniref:Uncharacterized protein n=1 Tax=Dreissena polymorpha TaxID=45954 RepID=A0A9D4BMY4_DREPO|nr:hypothetical protein DPMN_069296 [Dreissena polymorpha]
MFHDTVKYHIPHNLWGASKRQNTKGGNTIKCLAHDKGDHLNEQFVFFNDLAKHSDQVNTCL